MLAHALLAKPYQDEPEKVAQQLARCDAEISKQRTVARK